LKADLDRRRDRHSPSTAESCARPSTAALAAPAVPIPPVPSRGTTPAHERAGDPLQDR
jgi:hypothetical protein